MDTQATLSAGLRTVLNALLTIKHAQMMPIPTVALPSLYISSHSAIIVHCVTDTIKSHLHPRIPYRPSSVRHPAAMNPPKALPIC